MICVCGGFARILIRRSIALKKRSTRKSRGRSLLPVISLFKKIGILLLVAAVLGLAGWRVWHSDLVQMRFVYMWPYQNEIISYSQKNEIDPFLVAAIIKNESAFDRRAVSKVGAVGLMQVMPDTGEWIAQQMGLKRFESQDLFRTDVNIRLGCWYVSELQHEFKNNLVLVMIAYNAGRGQAKSWMQENSWDYDFVSPDLIPYDDTRNYVKAVLKDRDEYYRYYRDKVTKL